MLMKRSQLKVSGAFHMKKTISMQATIVWHTPNHQVSLNHGSSNKIKGLVFIISIHGKQHLFAQTEHAWFEKTYC
jgi:hypothetical protein